MRGWPLLASASTLAMIVAMRQREVETPKVDKRGKYEGALVA